MKLTPWQNLYSGCGFLRHRLYDLVLQRRRDQEWAGGERAEGGDSRVTSIGEWRSG